MTTAAWYHRDISRVLAEDLLARAGRDGSFLVRDSESVPGAYALCLLFQRHVHTYRILPDAEGLLAVQTSQGVQVNCFRTLSDLVLGYQQPHKGLVIPLLYPVGPEVEPGEESSDGDDEKPAAGWIPSGNSPVSTAPPAAPPAPVPLTPQQLLLQRLQDITTPSVASEVVSLLVEYLHGDLGQDLDALKRGGISLQHLQRTLSTVCHGLSSEIDHTLSSLETLAKVFDHPSCPLSCQRPQNVGKWSDLSLESLLFKISALCNLLSTLEKRVLKALQDAVVNHNLAVQPAPPLAPAPSQSPEVTPPVKNHTPPIPVHSFQVKLVRYGRMVVSVDVDTGVLLFDRKSASIGVETVTQDRILQLIKFQSSPAKLRMVVDSHHNTPRELLFESAKKREAFCHLLQLMKTRHLQQTEPDVISVFVGTWDMGGSPPPRGLQSWLTCCGLGRTPDESTAALPHDMYAVGTQENPQGEREWAEHVRASLRSATSMEYRQVAVQSLWNIRLAVFVRPEHENRITQVNSASVKTGLGNALGSKGAVGISFLFNGTSFGFVNCHLTSGSEKALRRNQNFLDVLRLLSLGDRQLSAFDISLRFTHLFWCGDLNYRLDLDVQDILKHVSKREFDELMCADQLTRERHRRKAFFNFKEEKITFPPTYRYERGSRDCYLWQKYKTSGVRINVPSWCDRVLWKSYPETHIVCTSYGCTDDIFTSDHSPVFATFQVGLTSPFFRAEWFCFEKDEKGLVRGRLSPQPARGVQPRASAPPRTPVAPNSYTNPAYFMFEGVPVLRRKDEEAHPRKEPQGVWARESVVQLPRVTGGNVPDRKPPRRSDFTEIEIPGCLPSYMPPCDRTSQSSPQHGTSYQLFPTKQPPPSLPTSSSVPPPKDYHLQSRIIKAGGAMEAVIPVKNLRNMYMNHAAITREMQRPSQKEPVRKERPRINPERTTPGRNGPPLYPYMSTRVPRCEASAPWVVEPPPGPCGDHSLTALQIAKSLSEVDFQPAESKSKYQPSHRPKQHRNQGNHPAPATEASYCWEKEVSVLHGAPETVQDLLSTLGLQRYTLGLSLNGWDDLDYFRGITEEDLHAAGVSNPSHRRRILENLPKIWD
ncbi:inositol polyphosphate phosphatase-like 1b isoform X2 [Alosa alosa]|uniref:inositol polyphosphate phosphatase-like 1b isoform X2 n=1 Tax=Alosa alosa TaxID=278164 RepID=UPI0020152688|nr:inositol polyphosphate phosphatase-like 1b isoform X2 [Alosa alosa]